MRPLTQAELDALARWHQAAGGYYALTYEDSWLLANLASELFLADHFERITADVLEARGFRQIGRRLTLRRDGDSLSCHRDCTDWQLNEEPFPRRLEPRFMGELDDIMVKLWGPK